MFIRYGKCASDEELMNEERLLERVEVYRFSLCAMRTDHLALEKDYAIALAKIAELEAELDGR